MSPSKKAPAKKDPAKKDPAKKSPSSKGTAKKKTSKASSTKKSTKKPTKKTAKTSAGKSPGTRKKKSPFPAKFLKEMEESLQSEREVYERQAAQLKAEADSLVADLDPGDVQFDEESGEGDTIAVERNRDLALASKALEMIDEIDHALSKFKSGKYGICEVSGEPIPTERLEAIPWAREKVEFKVGGFGRR